MDYAAFTAAPETQRGIYFESGGQPGHRSAWTDMGVNAASTDFFKDTLQTLDESILRPRHSGGIDFQDAATPVAHDAVAGRRPIAEAAAEICKIYDATLHV